ncbi:hypothetical protein C4E22_07920 [ANME-1 cluster archaeon AG-394-G06]|nr:hypothetical protein [ANME-1 cluster archaeon AG-394-G06]
MLNASEVDTYKMEMDMTMTTEMLMGNETNATEPMVMVMESNGSGVVDNINKSMMMVMSMCMNMSGIMEANTSEDTNGNLSENVSLDIPETICMETEMYIINNTIYMKMDKSAILPNQSQWLKQEMTEADWTSKDLQGQQMELLNCSNVTLLDDAEVNGVDCYVLKLVPDIETYWEIMMNQSKMLIKLSPGMGMQNTSDILNQSLINITMTEWIAKDTKFVMKSEAAVDMTISPDTEEEAKVAMDYTMTFYDYNVPVTIVLPPEAENAMDISDLLGMLPGGNETDILPGGNQTDGPR